MTLTYRSLTSAVTLGLTLACAAAEAPDAAEQADGSGGAPSAPAGGQSNPDLASGRAGMKNAASGGAPSAMGGASSRPPAGDAAAAGDDAENAIGGAYGVFGSAGEGGEGEPKTAPDVCQQTSAALGSSVGALVVRFKANTDHPADFLQGEIQISNEGYATVDLADLAIHYYFDSEYGAAETDALVIAVDHAQKSGLLHTNIGQGFVKTDVVVLDPALPGADAVAVLAFSDLEGRDGTLSAGETVLVQFRMQPPPSSSFNYYMIPRDQTNDYSFGACPLHASAFARIVLLRGQEVMNGEPPEGLSVPEESGGAGGMGAGGAPGADAGGAGGSS